MTAAKGQGLKPPMCRHGATATDPNSARVGITKGTTTTRANAYSGIGADAPGFQKIGAPHWRIYEHRATRSDEMKKIAKLLSAELDHIDRWTVDHHTLTHVPTNTHWWIANGRFFFDGYRSMEGAIGLIERHFLWGKAKRVRCLIIEQNFLHKLQQATKGEVK